MPIQTPRITATGGFNVPGRSVPSAPRIPIYIPPPIVFKTPIPTSTDLTLKSLGLNVPVVKPSAPLQLFLKFHQLQS